MSTLRAKQFTINEQKSKLNRSKSMEQHTYAIMNRVEDDHWWFVGRRAILRQFMSDLVASIGSRFKVQSSKLEKDSEVDQTNVELGTLNFEHLEDHGLKILDVGCGTGANLEMLAKFGKAEGVDVSDEALEFCRSKGLKVHKGLAEELPFEENEFDIVTALDVIEHLDDDIAGLSEMRRVVRKGGKALIFVPAFMWLWGVQDDISNHRIRYTRRQIVSRIESAGFRVERATYANATFFVPIWAGRQIMRLTGVKPDSENNINISVLNGFFGKVFGAESFWLKTWNFPFGVSIVITAEKS